MTVQATGNNQLGGVKLGFTRVSYHWPGLKMMPVLAAAPQAMRKIRKIMGYPLSGFIFKPGQWYESLVKPSFTPPNWLFPVAWTVIYLLLAWAGYRLTMIPGSQLALGLWAAQIALNTLWTPVFFGAHNLFAGMVVIVLLWLVVAALVVMALRLDLITGLILFPYLAWLSVAAALNFSILRNNR